MVLEIAFVAGLFCQVVAKGEEAFESGCGDGRIERRDLKWCGIVGKRGGVGRGGGLTAAVDESGEAFFVLGGDVVEDRWSGRLDRFFAEDGAALFITSVRAVSERRSERTSSALRPAFPLG